MQLLSILCLFVSLLASNQGVMAFASSRPFTTFVSRATSTALQAKGGADGTPFAVIVKAEIEPDRMAEFMEMIEFNAKETRKEPGCIRFDVLRSQDHTNEFFFYELYENAQAIDAHKATPHYAKWAAFKESGGTISSVSYKTDGEFLT